MDIRGLAQVPKAQPALLSSNDEKVVRIARSPSDPRRNPFARQRPTHHGLHAAHVPYQHQTPTCRSVRFGIRGCVRDREGPRATGPWREGCVGDGSTVSERRVVKRGVRLGEGPGLARPRVTLQVAARAADSHHVRDVPPRRRPFAKQRVHDRARPLDEPAEALILRVLQVPRRASPPRRPARRHLPSRATPFAG